jgi:hypothetical protein
MYGRAKLDLLKRRVLHHSKKSLERKDKNHQGLQVSRRKESKMMESGTNSQPTTTGISKVA